MAEPEKQATIQRLCDELRSIMDDSQDLPYDEFRQMFSPIRRLDVSRYVDEGAKWYASLEGRSGTKKAILDAKP